VASISVRDLDDHVKRRLQVRAAENGRSMEAEIRTILTDAVADRGDAPDLFATLIARVDAIGGVDLELPPRSETPRVVDLG
jgi:plasmid stability protein